jgi:ornithine cyclodeaminase
MLLLNDHDIDKCTDIPDMLATMAQGYRASVRALDQVPARLIITHERGRAFSLFMPASLPDSQVLGIKISSFFPANTGRGLAAVNGAVLLVDPETGLLQAMLDSAALTALRTAVMSALATDRLCSLASPNLAVVGAGVQARAHVRAIAAIRNLRRIRVVSRDFARSCAFAAVMSEETHLPVVAVRTMDEALEDADIVCTTTSHDSPRPLIFGYQLKHGVHINAIGGSTLQACEVDPQVLRHAQIHVDDPEAAARESGEISQALQQSIITTQQLTALDSLLQAPASDRQSAISYFRCVGHASQDMLVAKYLYATALRRQLGQRCNYLTGSMSHSRQSAHG